MPRSVQAVVAFELNTSNVMPFAQGMNISTAQRAATFEPSEDIVFEGVQVATPTGVVLVRDLSVRVPKVRSCCRSA